MKVAVNPKFSDFINDLIETGQYNSSSEVVEDALRLFEQKNIEHFRREIQKGLDSGPATPWNMEEFLKKARQRLKESGYDF